MAVDQRLDRLRKEIQNEWHFPDPSNIRIPVMIPAQILLINKRAAVRRYAIYRVPWQSPSTHVCQIINLNLKIKFHFDK